MELETGFKIKRKCGENGFHGLYKTIVANLSARFVVENVRAAKKLVGNFGTIIMKILSLVSLKRPKVKHCRYVVHHNKFCFCIIGRVTKLYRPPNQNTIRTVKANAL